MKPIFETVFINPQQASFKYFEVKQERLEPYWHYHPEFEITYVEQGEGLRFIGNNIEPFKAGDLILTGENLPHHWVSNDRNNSELNIIKVIQFRQEVFNQLPECASLKSLFKAADYGLIFPTISNNLHQKIKNFYHGNSLENFINLLEILNLMHLSKDKRQLSSVSFSNSQKNTNQDEVTKVTTYIFDNLNRPIPLAEIANFRNMTTPAFCRWFKKVIGCSFVTYLNKIRIEKACQLLLQTSKPIATIAYEVGFESVSHFNRVFKQLKLQSPSSYRKATLEM